MTLLRPYRRWWAPAILVLLCIPAILQLLPGNGRLSAQTVEGRKPALLPQLPTGLRTLQHFPAALDAYLDDHFGGRGLVLAGHGALRYWLRSPVSERVVYGRDGWLFLTDNRVLEQTLGALIRTDAVSHLVSLLAEINARLSANGRQFLAALIPNKHTIYKRYLPVWAAEEAGRTEYDLFLAQMAQAGVATIDLRPPLRLAAASEEPIFYSTDTHWNRLGALTAFDAIAATLGKPHWAADPAQVLGAPVARPGGDLARFLAVNWLLADRDRDLAIEDAIKRAVEWGDYVQRSYEVAGTGEKGTVLVVGDSFSRDLLRPYFARSVARLVWVHHQGCQFDWSDVDRFNPDTVLFLMAERLVHACLNNRPVGMDPQPQAPVPMTSSK